MVESLSYTESIQLKAFLPDETFAYIIDMSNYEVIYKRKKV